MRAFWWLNNQIVMLKNRKKYRQIFDILSRQAKKLVQPFLDTTTYHTFKRFCQKV